MCGFVRCMVFMSATIGFLCGTRGARGDVKVSLPLEGHYRPGRFVAVRVSGARGAEVRISAPGCVTTVVGPSGEGEVVVPFLVVSDAVTALQVSGARPVEMKAVGEGQRLVATADAEAGAAREIFPGEQLTGVSLDLGRPLLEPVLAWTGVDAVVLGPAARGRLKDEQISVLLAGGVTVAVVGGEKPDARWPWEKVKDVWVLRHEVAGPREVIRAEAYTPTYAWDRGLPESARRQIVFFAAVFAILVLGLSLWRGKYSTVAFVGLCAVTCWFAASGHIRGSGELAMRKTVVVNDGSVAQVDQWGWYGCLRESDLRLPVDELTIPVFASGRQIEKSEPRLVCDGRGMPVSYEFRLGVDESLALLTRSVRAEVEETREFSPPGLGWREFALDLYVGVGDRLEGERTDGAELSAIYVTRTKK